MKTATINIKTESATKKRLELFAKRTGMSLSDLVNLSLRRTLNEGQIVIEEPLVPNAATTKRLKKVMKDTKARKNLSPTFGSVEDAIKYLNLE